jgi:DNA invertase Pin-like site-specific DNA recombinase
LTVFGYARVSTDGQTLDAQMSSLNAAGAERVFAEKVTGIKSDRAALSRCISALASGDILVVTKLDRLARSTRDLLNTLAVISDKGASSGIRTSLDTCSDQRRSAARDGRRNEVWKEAQAHQASTG